jgi:acetyl-CoA carboxylase carboxyl transferase subunit alpha
MTILEKPFVLEIEFMSSLHVLDFERPVVELESKIHELRRLSDDESFNIADEVTKLQAKIDKQLKAAYSNLTAWQKTQVARHPDRPHTQDFIDGLIEGFVPLAGDRAYAEDHALIGGIGRFRGQSVMVLGQEKGRDMASRMKHNFGMTRPEGYRKAIRLMEMANKFGLPVLTLVDTAGAYPGVGAEERGQAEAIARSIQACLNLHVPIISTVIGEGGSGGAIAIAAANRVIMLEHSVYSVISPEGCASILWRDGKYNVDAANALKITAQDLKELKVIDDIVEEPLGGAHRHPAATIEALGDCIEKALAELSDVDGHEIKNHRRDKFVTMGQEGFSG